MRFSPSSLAPPLLWLSSHALHPNECYYHPRDIPLEFMYAYMMTYWYVLAGMLLCCCCCLRCLYVYCSRCVSRRYKRWVAITPSSRETDPLLVSQRVAVITPITAIPSAPPLPPPRAALSPPHPPPCNPYVCNSNAYQLRAELQGTGNPISIPIAVPVTRVKS